MAKLWCGMTKIYLPRNVRTQHRQWVFISLPISSAVKPTEQVPGDLMFPYVGKYIAHLTLAQIKTLDCGSKRQDGYRKISTLT